MNEITEVRLGRALFLPITGKLSSKSFSIFLYKAEKYIHYMKGCGRRMESAVSRINTHFTFISFGEKRVPTFFYISLSFIIIYFLNI